MASTEQRIRREQWRRATPTLVLFSGAAALAALLSRLGPTLAGGLPACPFHALTGWYCPGCGSTRALQALLNADVARAMAMNPLLVVCLPVLALMALNAAGWKPRGSEPFWRTVGSPKIWLIVLLGYWLLRNLPWWPFAWLAPG